MSLCYLTFFPVAETITRMGHIAMCIDHEQYLSCDFYLFANRHTIWMWRCGIVGSGDVHLLDGLLQLCRQTCQGSHHARNIVHLNHSVPTPIIISLNWLTGFYPWQTEELFVQLVGGFNSIVPSWFLNPSLCPYSTSQQLCPKVFSSPVKLVGGFNNIVPTRPHTTALLI